MYLYCRVDKCFSKLKNSGSVFFSYNDLNEDPENGLSELQYEYKNDDIVIKRCMKAMDLNEALEQEDPCLNVSKICMHVSTYNDIFKSEFKDVENVNLKVNGNIFEVKGQDDLHEISYKVTSCDKVKVECEKNMKTNASYSLAMLQKFNFKQCKMVELTFRDNNLLWVEFKGCDHVCIKYALCPLFEDNDDENDFENKRPRYD